VSCVALMACEQRAREATATPPPPPGAVAAAPAAATATAAVLREGSPVPDARIVVQRPDGSEETCRMPPDAYRALLAATNMKQRVRKLLEYSWADRLSYAVVGTPNLLEFDQGFFVKGGDGLADVKPIARLYKTQVYALARELGLPPGVAERHPTTETFSLPQTQEEFFFGYPYDRMDPLLWGQTSGVAAAQLAPRVGMSAGDVEIAYGEIERRRVATHYLHAAAIVPEP